MKMRVINNIFYRRGLPVLGVSKCRYSGFECFRPLCCNPCVLFRAYGAAARKSGQRRSCRSCRSCRSGRGGAGRRFWAVGPGGGWRGRTRRNRSVESGAAEVVPGLLFRAAVPGGGGVSDGGAGLAVSGGRAGRRRLCRTVALGGGGVGRWRSRWTEDGETERGWAGGRGRPPLPHACRWSVPVSVPVSVSVPSRKSDVRRGKTAPKLVFARTKAYL